MNIEPACADSRDHNLRRENSMTRMPLVILLAFAILLPGAVAAELDFWEYSDLSKAAHMLDNVEMIVPPGENAVIHMVLADRFGVVRAWEIEHGTGTEVWRSQNLDGIVIDLQVGDLDGDGWDDIVVITDSGRFYAWDGEDFHLLFESLSGEFERIHCFTVANVDDDDAWEIILNADRLIYYIDGINFTRDWTSVDQYEGTRMRCGDVDGDGRNELVMNTGQVIDTQSGNLEWEEEVFGDRLVLMDFDGDGVLEILCETAGRSLRVYEMDTGREKRFQ